MFSKYRIFYTWQIKILFSGVTVSVEEITDIFCLRYLCLFAYSGVLHILCCVFVLFVLVLCTPCCQFLWIVHFWLPLRYSLTFILHVCIGFCDFYCFVFFVIWTFVLWFSFWVCTVATVELCSDRHFTQEHSLVVYFHIIIPTLNMLSNNWYILNSVVISVPWLHQSKHLLCVYFPLT